MRVAFLGGTFYLGPVAVRHLVEAGHVVVVAHSGEHEHPDVQNVEHLHGNRDQLLTAGGLIERWQPDALIDTFAAGATAERASQLLAFLDRSETEHAVVVSSVDVYAHAVHAGMGDGSGKTPLPRQPIPIKEDAPLRTAPYPGGSEAHDNAAMENVLREARSVTALRPGAIYGCFPNCRERYFIQRIARGERALKLPAGGQQIFHRVAVERVARAIVSSVSNSPEGFWACNVVDPYDWTFAGLAAEIAAQLDWEWQPIDVPFAEADHPWSAAHPLFFSDRRLREILHIRADEPDPADALRSTVDWLWQHRAGLSPLPSSTASSHNAEPVERA
jgi:nucleoside-diphosphate-sugar epimerase